MKKPKQPDVHLIGMMIEEDEESILLYLHQSCPSCPEGHHLLLAQLNRRAFRGSEALSAIVDSIAMLIGQAVVAEISSMPGIKAEVVGPFESFTPGKTTH